MTWDLDYKGGAVVLNPERPGAPRSHYSSDYEALQLKYKYLVWPYEAESFRTVVHSVAQWEEIFLEGDGFPFQEVRFY